MRILSLTDPNSLSICLVLDEKGNDNGGQTPCSSKKSNTTFSDDDAASTSSGADFEPAKTRYSTPRRKSRRSVTEKRQLRSRATILKVINEADDATTNTNTKIIDDTANTANSMEATFTSDNIPDPPSPSLLANIAKDSVCLCYFYIQLT